MTAVRHAARLRELVEGAGFTLEEQSPGRFLIRWRLRQAAVGVVDVDARGFRAAFPDSQRRSSTPTELVDDLEDWTAGHQKGKW